MSPFRQRAASDRFKENATVRFELRHTNRLIWRQIGGADLDRAQGFARHHPGRHGDVLLRRGFWRPISFAADVTPSPRKKRSARSLDYAALAGWLRS